MDIHISCSEEVRLYINGKVCNKDVLTPIKEEKVVVGVSKDIEVPRIGGIWPGLGPMSTYAGKSLSLDGERIVHLILWFDDPRSGMTYKDAVKYAEEVKPEMKSHLPTRHQSIDLFNRLPGCFNKGHLYWTLTKAKSRNSAFVQSYGGDQIDNYFSEERKACAVSEISL